MWSFEYYDFNPNNPIVERENLANAEEPECLNDSFVLKHSLFRGPNELVWLVKSGSLGTIFYEQEERLSQKFFEFTTNNLTETMKYVGCNWDYDNECIKVRFQNYCYYYLNRPIFLSLQRSGTDISIRDILEELNGFYGDKYGIEIKYKDISLTSETLLLKYPSSQNTNNVFNFKGRGLDLLAKLATDFNLMFWFVDKYIVIGNKFQSAYKQPTEETDLLSEPINIEIRHSSQIAQYSKWGKRYSAMGVDEVLDIWCGRAINIPNSDENNSVGYIIYSENVYSGGGWESNYIVSEGSEQINEFDLCTSLKISDANYLFNEINQTKFLLLGRRIINGEGTLGYQHAVNVDLPPQNLQNPIDPPNIEKGERMFVIDGSPFAGDGYGLQFPSYNDQKSTEVILIPNDRHENAIAIGGVFSEKTAPKRDDPRDMRWTFNDGSSFYYDASENKLTISIKGKVEIGVNNSISASDTPTITGGKPAARQDDPTISNSTTDSSFWSWMSKFQSAISSWTPAPTDGGAVLKALLSSLIIPFPTSQTGKIQTGSSSVDIGD